MLPAYFAIHFRNVAVLIAQRRPAQCNLPQ